MQKYEVKLYPRALRDLDDIYRYIFENLQAPESAMRQLERLENGILELESMPYRSAERKTGMYANRGYRELLIDNYIVIYKILEEPEEVHVVTVQYYRRNF